MLTRTQEAYLLQIYDISQSGALVHISELAGKLGCRLPTVTRTISRMVALGVVSHEPRGAVHLTRSGRTLAEQLQLRHQLAVRFLHSILGVPMASAEAEARDLASGLTAQASQRLHHWLGHLDSLGLEARQGVLNFSGREGMEAPDFSSLPKRP
jgi:DtxR family transcriptional regulator, Mn-dependent transcriptional regulator